MSSLDVRLKETIKNESEEFKSIHKISHIATFLAGVMIVVSIFTWLKASSMEERAEAQMKKAQEQIHISWQYYNLYKWMEDHYPNIVDEYRDLNAASKTTQQ